MDVFDCEVPTRTTLLCFAIFVKISLKTSSPVVFAHFSKMAEYLKLKFFALLTSMVICFHMKFPFLFHHLRSLGILSFWIYLGILITEIKKEVL